MRDYGKIYVAIWRSKKFRGLPSDDSRLLYLYLHTSPHTNMIGCFVLNEAYAASDLKWQVERYQEAMDSLSKAYLIGFDKGESVVRIIDFIAHDPFTNPKHAVAAVRMAEKLPDCVEKQRLIDNLRGAKHVKITMFSDTLCDTLSKASRYIEPEPEPEQEPEPEPEQEKVRGRISIEIPPPPSSVVVAGFFADLRQAVGLAGDAQIPGWRDTDLATIVSEWKSLGLTEDRIITEAEASRDVHPEPPAVPKALTPWMQRAAARIPAQPVVCATPAEVHAAALKTRADWIAKGTCPPSMVSVSQAQELLAKGMVTSDQLRACGIVA